MAARTCRECAFVSHSQVAVDCPQCGRRLPHRVAGVGIAKVARAMAVLLALAAVGLSLRSVWRSALEPGRPDTIVSAPPDPVAVADTVADTAAETAAAEAAEAAAAARPATPSPNAWTPADHGEARSALAGPDAARRTVAAEWLGLHGGGRDVAALLEAMRDQESDVRWRATEALGRLLGTPAARTAAPTETKTAVAQMIAGLKDDEGMVRLASGIALGALNAHEATDALLEAFDGGSLAAIGAAQALGTMHEARAVAPLVKLLGDEQTRWHAAQGLGEVGGPTAEKLLLDALQKKDYSIMAGAHAFYMRRGGPGMEATLVELLQQTNDMTVADTFLRKGSPALVRAARAWADAHGYKLVKKDAGYFWEQTEAAQ